MNFVVVGTNHKYSPIEFREGLAFSKKRLRPALKILTEFAGASGAIILSTCNRVEIYASSREQEAAVAARLEDFLSTYHEINKKKITPYLYRYIGKEALRHIFEVAAGLDSQVLGETEILGQVKFFYEEARDAGFTDNFIDKIFNAAFSTGKAVRIKTRISQGNVSVASAGLSLIKREVKTLCKKKILIIGVGKVSGLVAKYLSKEEADAIFVSNRTYDKARQLAESIGARAIGFDRLKENLKDSDIVISATSSPHIVLKKEDLAGRLKPLLIVDLALPRDVDPRVREISGIRLFDLDNLKSVVEENLQKREIEAGKVRAIIDREVDRLWGRFIELEQEPALLP